MIISGYGVKMCDPLKKKLASLWCSHAHIDVFLPRFAQYVTKKKIYSSDFSLAGK